MANLGALYSSAGTYPKDCANIDDIATVFKNVDLLVDLDIEIPSYILFTNLVATRKNVDLPYRDRITDIVKDVYDNVQ